MCVCVCVCEWMWRPKHSEEFSHFLEHQKVDLIAYSHFLVDQFEVRGGAALQLLIPHSELALNVCRPSSSSSSSSSSSASSSSNSTANNSTNEVVCSRLVSHLPTWPIALFMLSAMCCLLFSTVYHLFSSHSEYIAMAFQRLDYAGICLLIAGSNIPVLYYGFACDALWRTIYIAICVALGLVCFVLTTSERFLSPKYRLLRTGAFIAMGASGAVPAVHLLVSPQGLGGGASIHPPN